MKRTVALVLALAIAGVVATTGSASTTPRSGDLHVTKECPPSEYQGNAGDFCTITSSNIPAIKPGMRVVYASAADFGTGTLDSDLVLDGPGHNNAFGHVELNLATFTGVVTFSGGTGRFSHFHAGPLAVACPAFPDCSWDEAYGFSPPAD